jgi:hypothetical protein
VQFAIPHSVLTSPAPEAISLIAGAACSQVPAFGAAICSAEVSLEFLMWTQADQGQGVITNFYWDWAFAGAWSFSPIPASNCLTAPPPVLHAGGDWCNANSDCQSGMCMQVTCDTSSAYCQHHECLCPTPTCFGNTPYINIQTQKGFFLTAAGGGSIAGANGVMNTNRTQAQAWETFSCHLTAPNQLSLQTANGRWVTAVNEGGSQYGGPNADPLEIQTNQTQASCWETFQIATTDSNQCTLKTNTGNFVTAVNGGGIGDNDKQNALPIHTNAMQQGPWETFNLLQGQQYVPTSTSWSGTSGLCPNNGTCCGRPDMHGNCDGQCVSASSCSGVTGYQCPTNTQCCGTLDTHGNCSGQCVATNYSCPQ